MNAAPPASSTPSRAAFLAVLALVCGVAGGHLGVLPATLEDIDSVNFALGVRDFDPAQHRPHPPGYPAYIAAGKAATAITRAAWPTGRPDRVEARALAALSLLGALGLMWLLPRVLAALAPGGVDRTGRPATTRRALMATLLFAACPLTWYLTSRPMSDVPGLTAACAALACLALAWWRQHPTPEGERRLQAAEMAASGRLIVLGALLAGLAIGFRSQTVWVTLPLLLLVLADRAGRGLMGALLGASVAFATGVIAWGIPLLVASGGLQAYLAALGGQAGEDFAGVEMLYLTPTPRLAAFTLLRTFIWPWDDLWLATAVLILAAIGALVLLVRERRTALAVAAIALPYLAFHLAFHDTTYARYALPVVVPVVFLAAVTLDLAGRAGAVGAVALAAWSLSVAAPQLQAYVERGSPTARLFDALATAVAGGETPTVGMHQALMRPIEAEVRPVGTLLPSPPRREWLELVRHWRAGGAGPVWFLADPRRTDLALVDPQARLTRESFGWNVTSMSLLGGMRPAEVALYRFATPGWFAAEGWSLTPETAGMAQRMGRAPHLGPISAFVRRRPEEVAVVIGGRNLGAAGDPSATFTVTLDGRDLEHWDVAPAPGFFVHRLTVPAGGLAGEGPWAELTIRSTAAAGTAPVATAVEQFDVQSPGVLMWAYGTGFHEMELDNALDNVRARSWRWMSDTAEIAVQQIAGDATLVIRGEAPLTYFATPSAFEVRCGQVSLGRLDLSGDFDLSIGIQEARLKACDGKVVLSTSQTFSPAERTGTNDHRRLGLRLFEVRLEPGLKTRGVAPITGQNTSDLR